MTIIKAPRPNTLVSRPRISDASEAAFQDDAFTGFQGTVYGTAATNGKTKINSPRSGTRTG